ncbi:pentapeptide repeat-containing protein [Nostoc sp. UCD121]|uniref:pentapeptide repeat-containing protein n=1 Tax=unclassified Nostoc TaxID=2593658 RepID=UPI0016268F4C|nr:MULTISPECIES: pentapeptide repeat-containing protein [unclassified Nostoc]MBC1223719.1 pentapeptide repeat-containing protein [Nostoc sp. UCD120]MBC1279539.1 pentapeptide repeat-containing protein [Nostoc sp. UCD121]MBC1298689.1 pentapeptide repeat-containing protein [Nostoc sp. UCD122]
MLTVIINYFHVVKNISSINNSQLAKICLGIQAFQEKINQTQHKSPKEHLIIAIEQLENNTIENSLAVINDLEQIAKNHPHYHWIIMNILTSFIRKNTLYRPQEEVKINLLEKVRLDIQAALTVIAKRDIDKDPKNEQLDLSYIDMRGANLHKANLQQTNLYQANLAGANLREANLAGAILSAANLEGANLKGANLEGAILSAANLKGANLKGANLHYASLYLADLHGAILNDAILDGANLREAKFSE